MQLNVHEGQAGVRTRFRVAAGAVGALPRDGLVAVGAVAARSADLSGDTPQDEFGRTVVQPPGHAGMCTAHMAGLELYCLTA